ncbi:hypothetical protein KQJ29_36005, partial [Enterococcus sp. S181_ASV_20]|nr:hypothetical protein [Enterococcus sp. S181_ASV_20]
TSSAASDVYKRQGHSFVMLTDTGYASEHVRGTIRDADAYLVESNHDLEMLRMGAYPWSLKPVSYTHLTLPTKLAV